MHREIPEVGPGLGDLAMGRSQDMATDPERTLQERLRLVEPAETLIDTPHDVEQPSLDLRLLAERIDALDPPVEQLFGRQRVAARRARIARPEQSREEGGHGFGFGQRALGARTLSCGAHGLPRGAAEPREE